MSGESNPNQKLETVFDSADETEAMAVQGLLESAGIESLVTSPDAPGEVMSGLGGVALQVPAEQAEEARRVIGEYHQRIVTILQSDDFGEAERIQSRLDSAEIEVMVRSLPGAPRSRTIGNHDRDATQPWYDVLRRILFDFLDPVRTHEIRIRKADVERARPILKELGVTVDISAEDESEEPPQAASA